MSARTRCRGTRGGAARGAAPPDLAGRCCECQDVVAGLVQVLGSGANPTLRDPRRARRCDLGSPVAQARTLFSVQLPEWAIELVFPAQGYARRRRQEFMDDGRRHHHLAQAEQVSSADGGQPAPDEEHLRARREAARDHRFARISSIAADQGELLHAKADWYGTYQHCGGRNLCQPRPVSVGQGRARHLPHSRRPAGRLEPRYRATGARTGADGSHHIRSG